MILLAAPLLSTIGIAFKMMFYNGVLVETKTLVELIRHYIRD
jgi:hypothetical protein